MSRTLTKPKPPRRRSTPLPLPAPAAGEAEFVGGFPTPAMLAAVGDPPEGTVISEADYERLVTEFRTEWVGGRIEYLPMNSDDHHSIMMFLLDALREHLRGAGFSPCVRPAGIGVRVPHRVREPDVIVLLDENDRRRTRMAWTGADLVVEIVSPDDPPRDTVRKRAEYAAAGVPEYWIVDPRPRVRAITVLALDGGDYREHGVFGEGETAASVLLPGFAADVAACLAAR